MTDVVFNTFGFNGTTLSAQPTSHKWIMSDQIGEDGSGRGIYAAYNQYELKWDFLTPAEFNEIYNFFQAIGQTGTVVASLPKFNDTTYVFYGYSGCVLRKPDVGEWFQNYVSDVRMLIVRILV